MNIWHEFKDLLIAIDTWPSLGFAVLLAFHKPLIDLLQRIQKINSNMLQIEILSAQNLVKMQVEPQEKTIPSISIVKATEIARIAICQVLDSLSDQTKRDEKVLQIAVDTEVSLRFMMMFTKILGSQIRLLRVLNPGLAVHCDQLKVDFYEPMVNAFPDAYKNYEFECWLNFLIEPNLLIRDANGICTISQIGREFLVYMDMQGLPEYKQF